MATERRIRVFVSSTFRDMTSDRDELMTHVWPMLRNFCRERQVELSEVDLRWGISEEQSTRRETLRLCLNEIDACRPFFICLLGERYGWIPGQDAFTPDLTEEYPWIADLGERSITELEVLHGALNDDRSGHSFFFFRDPAYSVSRGADFLPENPAAAARQNALKNVVRQVCATRGLSLYDDYKDPKHLAALVLEGLEEAIDGRFPKTSVVDELMREGSEHTAFAESRRRTYVARPEYYEALDRHTAADGKPMVVLGEAGAGKSALLANWLEHRRFGHPRDFIFEHYIGCTPAGADHWRLMSRLIAEIKRWTGDRDELPRTNEDILTTFPLWLIKLRSKLERDQVRCVVVFDGLNQLEDRDNAHSMGWLPKDAFGGPLRLIASTLPGKTLDSLMHRNWESLHIGNLTPSERRQVIAEYLGRFGKRLDDHRLERLATTASTENALYLKIILDELRVTGTHEQLDERLSEYLSATDIPTLLKYVLVRYQNSYERERPGLVSDALSLMWAARRGLTEAELLHLLKPDNLPKLPPAIWSPLRFALEDSLIDRGGVLNFSHDFLRSAVQTAFVSETRALELRVRLADEFEKQAVSARSCDELPWLLQRAGQRDRLRDCLLNMDRFLEIYGRDEGELRQYWVDLGEEKTMGDSYLDSFAASLNVSADSSLLGSYLSKFLVRSGLNTQTERLTRLVLLMDEWHLGPEHPDIARDLNNLGQALHEAGRFEEAEQLLRRALSLNERYLPSGHRDLVITLVNLARLLRTTNQLAEAEQLFERALAMCEGLYGIDRPEVALVLNNLASLFRDQHRLDEAELLLRRTLDIVERSESLLPELDLDIVANNLVVVLLDLGRPEEAVPLARRVVERCQADFGTSHPRYATALNNLAQVFSATGLAELAESLFRRALAIDRQAFDAYHPNISRDLNNLAALLQKARRLDEAEPLMREALAIDEKILGAEHPRVANRLDNLATLLMDARRIYEIEPLLTRSLAIRERSLPRDHPDVDVSRRNLKAFVDLISQFANKRENEAVHDFRESEEWFLIGADGGSGGVAIECPRCSWQGTWYIREEYPPAKCPRCGESPNIFKLALTENVRAMRDLLEDRPHLVHARDSRNATPLHYAAASGHYQMTSFLIESGADIEASEESNGFTPLLAAVRYGRSACAARLLSAAAIIEARDKNGFTPLLEAAGWGELVTAKLLLEYGANVHAKNDIGYTPLHLAASWGHVEIVEALLAAGADKNAVGENGLTPLHAAAVKGQEKVVEILLRIGANRDARNIQGETPADQAQTSGHILLAQLLL